LRRCVLTLLALTVLLSACDGGGDSDADRIAELEAQVDALQSQQTQTTASTTTTTTLAPTTTTTLAPTTTTTLAPTTTTPPTVPRVVLSEYTGFSALDALAALSNLGVQTVVAREFHPTVPDGGVIRTEPGALQIIPKNQVVTLVVSLGVGPVAVPSLVGNTEAEAQNALTALGLTMAFGEPINVTAESGQEGIVLEQQTPPSVLVEPGTTITVRIGRVPPPPSTTTTSPTTTTTP